VPVKNAKGQVFLNLSEIADRWGITAAAVARYHVGGDRMPSRRHGRAILVLAQDLADYEELVAAELEQRIRDDMERLQRFNEPIPVLVAELAESTETPSE
jgi:hypothetical protein